MKCGYDIFLILFFFGLNFRNDLIALQGMCRFSLNSYYLVILKYTLIKAHMTAEYQLAWLEHLYGFYSMTV